MTRGSLAQVRAPSAEGNDGARTGSEHSAGPAAAASGAAPGRDRTVLFLLLLALGLRLALLGAKPLHSDEGVNGWFVDRLLETGVYAYDPENYHGPLLFYLVGLSELLFGRNAWALRLPSVLFGVGSVWLLSRLGPFVGERAARAAALFLAVSPAAIYYSRAAIHEPGFLFFTLLTVVGFLRLREGRARAGLWQLGLGLAGMVATKEAWILHAGVFAAAWAAAALLARIGCRSPTTPPSPAQLPTASTAPPIRWLREGALVAGACTGGLALLYSAFGRHPEGLTGLMDTVRIWTGRAVEGAGHEKPFLYWAELLGRYEWPALAGLVLLPAVLVRSRPAVRLVALYGLGVFLAYSLVPYKTPWCVLQLLWPLLVVAGVAGARLAGGRSAGEGAQPIALIRPPEATRRAVALALVLAALPSAVLAVRLNLFRATDPAEPYAYVQTRPEVLEIVADLDAAVRRDPTLRDRPIHVLMEGDGWPLPWLLARYPGAGYYTEEDPPPGDALLILCDEVYRERVEPRLRRSYEIRPFSLHSASRPALAYFDAEAFATAGVATR